LRRLGPIFCLLLVIEGPAWPGTLSPQGKDPAEAVWSVMEASSPSPSHPSPELKKLLGKPIELTGWIIPNEFEGGELAFFLLAHFPRGCVHVPLPPPNSVVEVEMAPGASKLKDVTTTKKVKVHGVIRPGERVDASYKIQADSVQLVPL